ncbi:DUF1403 family protein [Bradyrhizobium sp. CCBAU 21360]|uniref:DUF1403 family protein n=1 Tax=Bradyrhizobium sp. CCBAU 21360 TaxID=1325081 RepID=UPI002305FF4B|nr:DUF1403 family protein [Bradyrhizobium sp. CCBAU 21360]MDA9448288.1 hypothetical protein [Bradyrhizobium sp. CCBAU 21360]
MFEPPPTFVPAPSWLRRRAPPDMAAEAVFYAGAALAALHPVARDEHPLGSLWRQRLALSCAATLARQGGRTDDEAALRDYWYLRRDDDDPGPGGRILGAWRKLGERASSDVAQWNFALAPALGHPLNSLTDQIVGLASRHTQQQHVMPVLAAAEIIAASRRVLPNDDVVPLWLADAVLAHQLRWPAPVPLLAAHLSRGALRKAPQHFEGETVFMSALCAAYTTAAVAAIDLYNDLALRAARLLAVAPKLRGKDAGLRVGILMVEDAQIAGAGKMGTDRSTRRLFQRLVSLGAARELTGRPTFRLYGL